MSMLASLLHQTYLPLPVGIGHLHLIAKPEDEPEDREKECPKCGDTLSMDNFYLRGDGRYSSWCMNCTRKHHRKAPAALAAPSQPAKEKVSCPDALTGDWSSVKDICARTELTRATVTQAMKKPEVIARTEKRVVKSENRHEKFLWRLKDEQPTAVA